MIFNILFVCILYICTIVVSFSLYLYILYFTNVKYFFIKIFKDILDTDTQEKKLTKKELLTIPFIPVYNIIYFVIHITCLYDNTVFKNTMLYAKKYNIKNIRELLKITYEKDNILENLFLSIAFNKKYDTIPDETIYTCVLFITHDGIINVKDASEKAKNEIINFFNAVHDRAKVLNYDEIAEAIKPYTKVVNDSISNVTTKSKGKDKKNSKNVKSHENMYAKLKEEISHEIANIKKQGVTNNMDVLLVLYNSGKYLYVKQMLMDYITMYNSFMEEENHPDDLSPFVMNELENLREIGVDKDYIKHIVYDDRFINLSKLMISKFNNDMTLILLAQHIYKILIDMEDYAGCEKIKNYINKFNNNLN
jgi:hypothetical protein